MLKLQKHIKLIKKSLPLLAILLSTVVFVPASFAEDNQDQEPEVTGTPSPGTVEPVPDDTTTPDNSTPDTNNNIQTNSPFSQQNFVPDISFILDSSYIYRNLNNETYGSLTIPGFLEHHESDGHEAEHGTVNGFNLNYGELVIASTVDPYIDLNGVFHFTLEGIEIEEAFVQSRSIPFGFQLKAGKFLSGFGRQNSQHAHYWDFGDPPLVYRGFFGSEGMSEKGLQATWLAPTDLYLLLGAEILQGENEQSFGTAGFKLGNNDIGEINYPNLITGFVKTSVEIEDLVILGGLSYLRGGTRMGPEEDEKPEDQVAFAGDTNIFGGDLTLKYFFDSYRNLSWQSEYYYRITGGNNYKAAETAALVKNQSGFYSQLTWRFDQLWKTGIRFDLLNKNDITEKNIAVTNPANLARYSAMLEFKPSEFSRLRLQYNHDRSGFLESNVQAVNEVSLQLNMAIGAHQAHQL